MPATARQVAAATERNREPILSVMQRVFPEEGLVLEISSGSGEHAAFFSRRMPSLIWQPSDISPEALESIEAWRGEGSNRLRPPIALDTRTPSWPVKEAQVVVNINMIHIAPWEACEGLMRGAGRVLPAGGLLLTYGPYRVGGRHTAPSNEAFDASLRQRDPAWGVRDLEAVEAAANSSGIVLVEKVPMPANNFSLVFRRDG